MKRALVWMLALALLLGVAPGAVAANEDWLNLYKGEARKIAQDSTRHQFLMLADLNGDGTPELLLGSDGLDSYDDENSASKGQAYIGGRLYYIADGQVRFSDVDFGETLGTTGELSQYRRGNGTQTRWILRIHDVYSDTYRNEYYGRVKKDEYEEVIFEVNFAGGKMNITRKFSAYVFDYVTEKDKDEEWHSRGYSLNNYKRASEAKYMAAYKAYFAGWRKVKSAPIAQNDAYERGDNFKTAAGVSAALEGLARAYPQSPAVPMNRLTLNRKTLTAKVNKDVKLKATVRPANATNRTVMWYSSDPKIAYARQRGLTTTVVPLRKGTATIYCMTRDGGNLLASCKVTVQ